MKVLVAAASRHGSTWEIARVIGDTLTVWGVHVDMIRIEEVKSLAVYDAFIIGSAVYAGHWLQSALSFMHDHAAELTHHPVWLFSSGPLGSSGPAESKVADIHSIAELVRIKDHRVFSGRLESRGLGLIERRITAIVGAPQGDFRDWEAVRSWACGIARSLKRQTGKRHESVAERTHPHKQVSKVQ